VAPLRQLAAGVEPGVARLFAPAPKVRMRSYSRFQREPVIGVVNYARADTSVVGVEVGESALAYLDAGENPPVGVVFRYYLGERPAGGVRLRILDEGGNHIRTYSSSTAGESALPAEPGVNCFHWNLRYPGAEDVTSEFTSWSRPDGPMVVPGSYVAELEVDGETQRQPFEILPDPRVAAGPGDLTSQRDMLFAIRDTLGANNRLINRIAALRQQVRGWCERSDDHAVNETGQAILDEVNPLLPKLIDVNIHQAQLYASGLHEKLNALFDSVDSADYAPPQQARDVFQELTAQLDRHSMHVETVIHGRLLAFNDAVRAAGLEPAEL
jgi:hypothetical protein